MRDREAKSTHGVQQFGLIKAKGNVRDFKGI